MIWGPVVSLLSQLPQIGLVGLGQVDKPYNVYDSFKYMKGTLGRNSWFIGDVCKLSGAGASLV